MPLTFLTLTGTAVTDLSPLLQCPKLETLTLPDGAKNVKSLIALKGLTRLSYRYKDDGKNPQKATDFWWEYEQNGWRQALREAGIKPKSEKLLGDKTWDVNLENTKISDLSVLTGARINITPAGSDSTSTRIIWNVPTDHG